MTNILPAGPSGPTDRMSPTHAPVPTELTLGWGMQVWHGNVEALIARDGLRGVSGRPRWIKARSDLISIDLVDRKFSREQTNQPWVSDITEHPTRESKVYCALVLDVCRRRVVDGSIDSSPTAALTTNALGRRSTSATPRPEP
jgi:putative transposase